VNEVPSELDITLNKHTHTNTKSTTQTHLIIFGSNCKV